MNGRNAKYKKNMRIKYETYVRIVIKNGLQKEGNKTKMWECRIDTEHTSDNLNRNILTSKNKNKVFSIVVSIERRQIEWKFNFLG